MSSFNIHHLMPTSLRAVAVNGSKTTLLGEAEVQLVIGSRTIPTLVYIMENFSKDILLGRDFKEQIDLEEHTQARLVRAGDSFFDMDTQKPVQFPFLGRVAQATRLDPLSTVDVQVKCPRKRGTYLIEPTQASINRSLNIHDALVLVEDFTTTVRVTHKNFLDQLIPEGFPLVLFKPNTLPRQTESLNIEVDLPDDLREEMNALEEELIAACEDEAPDCAMKKLIGPAISGLKGIKQQQLIDLFVAYGSVVSKHKYDLGLMKGYKHHINTGDAPPVKKAPYRMSQGQVEALRIIINKMKEHGLLVDSSSPWSSPIVLVKKPDGSWRLCNDFRELNKITKKICWPLPRMEDLFDRAGGMTTFSTIDLTSGFWQLALDEASQEKTAFCTPFGLFQHTRLSMGLVNGPPSFQACMQQVLGPLLFDCCLVYLDDILVFSKDFDSHLLALKKVLTRLKQFNLKLKPEKCKFCSESVHFLGHVLGKDGVSCDPSKLERVANWPIPINEHEIQSFMGLVQYYRRFIPHCSSIGAPLYELLKKGVPFEMTPERIRRFELLKKALTSAPVVQHPDTQKRFIVAVDGSKQGLGAVLKQLDAKGNERVVAYASRTLHGPENNYHAGDLELLAMKWALDQFRVYLLDKEFTLITDHKGLLGQKRLERDPTGRIARWISQIMEYNFVLEHKPGRKHADADALSRQTRRADEQRCNLSQNPTAPGEAVLYQDEDEPSTAGRSLDEQCMKAGDENKIAELVGPNLEKLKQEKWTQLILKALEEAVNKNICEKYRVENQRLWRITQDKNKRKIQQCVDIEGRSRVLLGLHDHKSHMGSRRTVEVIKKWFFWPKMNTHIHRYVRSCKECQLFKANHQRPVGEYSAPEIPDIPFSHIHIDVAGPMRVTAFNKMTHYIAAIDRLTKYAVVKPIISNDSASAARFLEQLIFTYGMVRKVTTDNGKEFIGSEFRNIIARFNIEHHRTAAGRPTGNGQIERLNYTLKNFLATNLAFNHSEWSKELPRAVADYNSSIHEITGYEPHYLLYGYAYADPGTPKLPDDLLLNREEQLVQVEEARAEAKKKISKYIEAIRDKYNVKRAKTEYVKGDQVMVKCLTRAKHGTVTKFNQRYVGPCTITRRVEGNSYLIQAGRKITKHHADQLKPFVSRDDPAVDEPTTKENIDHLFANSFMLTAKGMRPAKLVREEPVVGEWSEFPFTSTQSLFLAVNEHQREG